MTTDTAIPAESRAPQRRRRGGSGGRTLRSIGKHTMLAAFSAIMIYPLIWLLVSSFKPNSEIFRDLSVFTTDLTVENYANGWDDLQFPFGVFIVNSSLIAFGAIVGNLFSCSLAAYAFARLRFRGRRPLFAIMLGSIMLPFQVLMVPQFIIFKELGWLNTVLPLIAPKFLATEAFFVFLMVQFIRNLPKELFEAARIDGAGHFRSFFQITLPLIVPALATTAIFTFIWTWGDFFGPLVYLRLPETWPVSLALKGFLDAQSSSDYGSMFAMSVVSLLPMFLVFLLGQRFLIKGVATTGIK
ncbi:carbohydrate ABC transporter permease [Glycomyces sp. TRM65418]|uniref:carbohydrate ABC transporter permease n=1 Tax=Glycomyces sp. TRM65418 TaxID=2867006 RepID=UPI001CE6FF36|nr:carbohydrate ABC transporter permease [Glycomyces sp. TRM65418]MCC3763306.1 carbohydrate ABC transporter permease [Glycomyces sp. TRM65418]QZD57305.1 carbohydrate ABC transporter permease [Glycomyces sp. TRM65418]